MSTDRIVFEMEKGTRVTAGWQGEWPPPEQLYVLSLDLARGVGIIRPQDCSPAEIAYLDQEAVLFTRRSASSIKEPAPEGEHWFRGALYMEGL